jgi:hypothetical protein
MIDEKANATAKTNKTLAKPPCEEISIQVGELLDGEKRDRGIDLSDLPEQGFPSNSSNFTARGYFPHKVDNSVQGNLDRGVSRSAQVGVVLNDMSIQKYEDGLAIDCSIQKYGPAGEDFSIQNSRMPVHEVSVQRTLAYRDRSIQPTLDPDHQENAMYEPEDEVDYNSF